MAKYNKPRSNHPVDALQFISCRRAQTPRPNWDAALKRASPSDLAQREQILRERDIVPGRTVRIGNCTTKVEMITDDNRVSLEGIDGFALPQSVYRIGR